jgi:DNA segregation ATPase FtsK/SpoIIIE-like protein
MRQSPLRSTRRTPSRARTTGPGRFGNGAGRAASRSRKPSRPLLTPAQAREASGVALIGLALLFFIAFAPALKAAFGWGAPLVVVVALGGGLYLIWPKAPAVRAIDVASLFAIVLSALGLLSLPQVGGGAVGGTIAWWVASYVGAWGAGVILAMALLLGLIVVFHFSPAATLGAMAATARAAHAERRRIEALVRRAGPKPDAERQPKAVKPTPAAAPPPAPEPIKVLEEPSFLEQLDQELPEEPPAPPRPAGAEPPQPPPAPVMRVVADPVDDEPEIDWKLPGINLLETATARKERMQDEIKRNVRVIEHTLATFGVEGKVVGVNPGPAVTQYEIQPGEGVPVRKIVSLHNDLALALAASPLRIEAPIPGKSAVGVEVPNKSASLVTLREVVGSPGFKEGNRNLALALGNDVSGQPIVGDMTRMPHLLIAGATGQGKSVCINALIASMLMQATPAQLRLMLIDPKRVEMSAYNGLPHLMVPVLVEPHQAAAALRWAVAEMDRRYKLLSGVGVRNIQGYNEKAASVVAKPLPYVVIVVDELADLMMVAAGEVEELICRIAQLARAVGIHLIVATQRPSTDIITGLIKANIPSRIAFAVGSQVDSRVILDSGGAEKLLGRGDMLYQPVDAGKPARIQGAFVSDGEVDAIVNWWKAQGEPRFMEEVLDEAVSSGFGAGGDERKLDPLFARAARAVAAEGGASVSLVQRKFNVGYSRAGRIVDQLAEHRVIGGYQGSKSREVLMNLPDVDELLERIGLE